MNKHNIYRIISFLWAATTLFSFFVAYPSNPSYAEDVILADIGSPEYVEIQEVLIPEEIQNAPEEVLAAEEAMEEISFVEELMEEISVQPEFIPEPILEPEYVPAIESELESVVEPEAEVPKYKYPWQGKTDAEFAGWMKSRDNEGYLKTIYLDNSGVYAEEIALLEARIEAMDIGFLKDDISSYVKELRASPEQEPNEEETVANIQESPFVMMAVTTEVFSETQAIEEIVPEKQPEIFIPEEQIEKQPEEQPGNLIPEGNKETVILDEEGSDKEETGIIEVPIEIIEYQPFEEAEKDDLSEEPGEKAEEDGEKSEVLVITETSEDKTVEDTIQYVWNFVDDSEFKAWVLDKQNRKYIKNMTGATDDPVITAENEAFERRIEAVADEEDKQEIRKTVSMLSAPMFLTAAAPKKTYIKGRDNAIKFIEDNLIARKTSFDLLYECDGVVKESDVRSLALELLREANGSYLDTYNGNGNGSDYIAFQSTSGAMGCGIDEQTGSTTKMTFCYYASYYDTADEEAQVQSAAASLLSSLGISGKSNYEKAKAIYTWVVSNVKYGGCSDNPQTHPYSAYGALIEKKAVCQGISALVYKLMNDAGVPCRTMASAGHNWNIVQIDGVWYIIDATNGTLGADYYFLIGTDTYSRYQQPMSGYVEMWNSLSKKSYEQATAATTGTICTNVKWTIQDNVLILEPADPTKYSSLASNIDEYSNWQREVVNKHYSYVNTVLYKNISDYGSPRVMSGEYCITGGSFPYISRCIHQGAFPTNAYIYIGEPDYESVEIPCNWTDNNIKAMGFYWYLDKQILTEHTTLKPDGQKIVKVHDFSIAQEPATCTEPGGSILICSYCGEKKETGSSLPALGHNYVEFERKDATCKEAGYVKSKCSRCDDVKTETLKKLDHIKDEGTVITPATCTKEGEISYTCTFCHADLGKEKLEMKEHEYKETSRTEATCEADGKVVSTCDICKGTKEETLKALGHDPKPMPPTETTTGGIQCERCKKILEEPTQGIAVSLAGVGKGETVYINGIPFTASANNQVIIPANMRNVTSASTYSYGSGSGGSYPTGMKVWILSQDNKTGLVTSERASYLDNLMTYSGTSIRLKGNQGIAIHTDINSGTWNSLVSGGYHGYKVQEAGLLVTKTFENETPTYGGSGVIMGKAYDRNGSIRSVNPDGARCYYMNTLVFGNDMEKTKWNLACRPYMIVKDSNGNSITLYGGILVRSVRSVAQQIQPMYKNDKAVSDFINKILSA